jgi:hypothetical protein
LKQHIHTYVLLSYLFHVIAGGAADVRSTVDKVQEKGRRAGSAVRDTFTGEQGRRAAKAEAGVVDEDVLGTEPSGQHQQTAEGLQAPPRLREEGGSG